MELNLVTAGIKNALIGQLESGKKGIDEIEHVINQSSGVNVIVDFTLARGLDYYTGIIFEARAPQEVKIGSIGGGGRYDDLTGLFGVPGVPGVPTSTTKTLSPLVAYSATSPIANDDVTSALKSCDVTGRSNSLTSAVPMRGLATDVIVTCRSK